MYEPALVVLQPAEKIRKYFPCRNIVVEGKEREENPYNRYFPVVCLCDFGAIDSSVSKTNERFREDKRKNPRDFPCLTTRSKAIPRGKEEGRCTFGDLEKYGE